jgi:TRAP-type C4-dicarboxylate transport system permease large subunit
VTAVVLFMIVGASMYSRMLGVSGLPTEIGTTISAMSASYELLIAIYVAIVIALGTLIDSVSIMLIMVPLFSVILAPYNVDMLWFGIVTIIAAEIGLLTPPFGLSAFVVHSTLARADIPLKTVFLGSAYFAATMLAVLLLLIAFPPMATYLVEIRR